MTADGARSWRAAMTESLYGESGFYLGRDTPAQHFRTSAHVAPSWARAVLTLATRIESTLDSAGTFTVVDVGAGGGELLTELAALAPMNWSLCGVDLAPRPAALPSRVGWSTTLPLHVEGLVIANELLDVVPIDVAQLTDDGPRMVEVTTAGVEQLGDAVRGRDADWLAVWWPLAEAGDRAEIGWPRDDLWRSLTDDIDRGLAIAIDYAADPARHPSGTLTGYRDGQQVLPVSDGSCDLTAHVRFESLTAADDVVLSQREALAALGVDGNRPAYDGDPSAYLSALADAGEVAELTDPAGLGGFTWLSHAVDIPNPFRPA